MRVRGSTFFKYVWRYNAIAIAFAATAFVIAGLIALSFTFEDFDNSYNVSEVVNIDQNDRIIEHYVYGQGQALQGRDFLFVPLQRDQNYKSGVSDKNTENNTVNYLIIDQINNKSKWLNSNSSQLYFSFTEVYDNFTPGDLDTEITKYIVYNVVEKDANGDKRLSNLDKFSLYASSFDGSNYRLLVSDVDEVYSMAQTLNGDFLIFYRKNNENFTELYNLSALKLVSRNRVTPLKK